MTVWNVVLDSPYGESGIRDFQVESEDLDEVYYWIELTTQSKEKVLSISPVGEASDTRKD
jgi:hypothetical protein